MQEIVNFIILAAYLFSLFFIGRIIVRTWFTRLPSLLGITGAFLLGTGIGIPATYVFSCLFAETGWPIEWGVGCIIVLAAFLGYWFRRSYKRVADQRVMLSDILLVMFSLLFSFWLMTKTFHGGPDGQLFVGSNNVFDFGFTIGLIRSVSWGSNIPFMSPFFSGLPIFYHYMFAFWVALWEYFGIPIVWAMNIPSILSFASLLIVVYYLAQVIWKQSKLIGWIAVFLTITNSTTTFWQLLATKGLSADLISTIWSLPTYPFRGPYDGSVISIFMTLNNYVNQRHLSFSVAIALFLFIVTSRYLIEKRRSLKTITLLGVLTGVLWIWNMPVFIVLGATIVCEFAVSRKWKDLLVYGASMMFVLLIPLAPYLYQARSIIAFIQLFLAAGVSESKQLAPDWTAVSYWWNNLGILPIAAGVGLVVLPRRTRFIAIPLLTLFVIQCIMAVVGHRGFDQKFFSFLIIGVNVCAAVMVEWLVQKRSFITFVIAGAIILAISVSGIVDLMAVKNEFAYPLIGPDTAPVIAWIHTSTPKDAVFVSYSDIIDPVVLAGRRNFFGFFGNIGSVDRSAIVSRAYQGDIGLTKTNHISYILVPKWAKNDFPYTVNILYFRQHHMVVYEDKQYSIIDTQIVQ